MKIPQTILAIIIGLILLTGCGSNGTEAAPVSTAPVPVTGATATVAGPLSTDEAGAAAITVPAGTGESAQPEEQAVLASFSKPVTAGGQPLVLYGHLLDASGAPLSGYVIEIWQVDANGIYDHPGDRNTANRDPGFQFYGTALTDENGLFSFRTVVPARYEPRPKHIHFKVKKDGAEVLTSQFYFNGEVDPAQLGPGGEALVLDLKDAQSVKLAVKDIVIDTGSGGNLALTPSQTEGPYYPVVDVSTFDNDLASVQ